MKVMNWPGDLEDFERIGMGVAHAERRYRMATEAKKSAKSEAIEKKKFVTPEGRVSFPQVFESKAFGNQPPKFSMTLLFDKKTDLTVIKQAVKNAAIEEWGDKADKMIAKIKANPQRWPFKDGNEKADMVGYKDMIYITASAKAANQPGLISRSKQPILDEKEFYAGCYARAELIAYAYDNEFGQGLGFSLQNIQKLREGEPFSGKRDAANSFDDLEELEDETATETEDEDDMGF